MNDFFISLTASYQSADAADMPNAEKNCAAESGASFKKPRITGNPLCALILCFYQPKPVIFIKTFFVGPLGGSIPNDGISTGEVVMPASETGVIHLIFNVVGLISFQYLASDGRGNASEGICAQANYRRGHIDADQSAISAERIRSDTDDARGQAKACQRAVLERLVIDFGYLASEIDRRKRRAAIESFVFYMDILAARRKGEACQRRTIRKCFFAYLAEVASG